MKFKPGVLTGQDATDLLNYANENNFALPAPLKNNTLIVIRHWRIVNKILVKLFY